MFNIYFKNIKRKPQIINRELTAQRISNELNILHQLLYVQSAFCGRNGNLSSFRMVETVENLMCYNNFFYKFCFLRKNQNCFKEYFKNRNIKSFCEFQKPDYKCFVSRDVFGQRTFYDIRFQCNNPKNSTSLFFIFLLLFFF